mgnify:CR=1 FL=1
MNINLPELITALSLLITAVAGVLAFFSQRRATQAKELAEILERVAGAMAKGIEGMDSVLKSNDAKKIKEAVQAIAEKMGIEDEVHSFLVKLGYSEEEG